MQKLYCYVDEAGQHMEGRLFVVSVVVLSSAAERDRLARLLETIEQVSRKRLQKWRTSRHEERFAYMTAILTNSAFSGLMYYQMHFASRAYVEMTVQTTAAAIRKVALAEYKTTTLIDGLPESRSHAYASALRRLGVRTHKVRGVDDRKNTFIRLADALCGMVIDAYEGNEFYTELLDLGKKNGSIRQL